MLGTVATTLQKIKNGVLLRKLTVEIAGWGRERYKSAMTPQDGALGAMVGVSPKDSRRDHSPSFCALFFFSWVGGGNVVWESF